MTKGFPLTIVDRNVGVVVAHCTSAKLCHTRLLSGSLRLKVLVFSPGVQVPNLFFHRPTSEGACMPINQGQQGGDTMKIKE